MIFSEVTSELKGVVSPDISVFLCFFWGGRVCGGVEGGLKHNGMDGIVKIMFRLFVDG